MAAVRRSRETGKIKQGLQPFTMQSSTQQDGGSKRGNVMEKRDLRGGAGELE